MEPVKRIKANFITPPVDREVTLTLPESEAQKLMSLLMDKVDWYIDKNGLTARDVWEALEAAGIPEA